MFFLPAVYSEHLESCAAEGGGREEQVRTSETFLTDEPRLKLNIRFDFPPGVSCT